LRRPCVFAAGFAKQIEVSGKEDALGGVEKVRADQSLLMQSSLLSDDRDMQAMRECMAGLSSKPIIVDFEEQILLASIRVSTRIWKEANHFVGFAFVDEYNNLWFESETGSAFLDQLETEIVGWGLSCIRSRSLAPSLQFCMWRITIPIILSEMC
jgi:hypothetical protein